MPYTMTLTSPYYTNVVESWTWEKTSYSSGGSVRGMVSQVRGHFSPLSRPCATRQIRPAC